MQTCVAYESMFGNTHSVAEAIAAGLVRLGDVSVGSIAEIDAAGLVDVDLLVVGGPTHVHGLSKLSSRRAAEAEADDDDDVDLDEGAQGPGLRSWLKQLPEVDQPPTLAAAFDTRIDKPAWLVGSAAKGIARRLGRHRFTLILEPQSFFVDDSTGPLHEGELERARRWGVDLAAEAVRLSR